MPFPSVATFGGASFPTGGFGGAVLFPPQPAPPPFVYDTDAQAFFDASGVDDNAHKAAVNQLVLDLKTANLWNLMDVIYPFVGGNADKHAFNLKDPNNFQMGWNGTVTHNANGVTGDGSTGYGDTGYFTGFSGQMVVSSFHTSFYSRVAGGSVSSFQTGCDDGTYFLLHGKYTNTHEALLGDGSIDMFPIQTTNGMCILNNPGIAQHDLYGPAGSLETTNSEDLTGTTLPFASMYICGYNDNGAGVSGASNSNTAFVSMGAALPVGGAPALRNAVQTLQKALFRQIPSIPIVLTFPIITNNGAGGGTVAHPKVGDILTTSNGTWDSESSIIYTYQWGNNHIGPIGGATNVNYTIQSSDISYTITPIVTATNAVGATSTSPAATGAVS